MTNDSTLMKRPVETRVSWESRGWSLVELTDIYVPRVFAASRFLSLRLFATDKSSIPIRSKGLWDGPCITSDSLSNSPLKVQVHHQTPQSQ
jgi:hypothetical protein